MSASVAIQIQDLGKCYHIYDRPQDRLKQTLWHGRRQYFREFWALRNVSFTVHRGEAVGIIGRNGSGKSTLLQMIAGTLQPTEGQAQVHGRVAALLELGSGFNPEFTGRENVFLNATILGLSRKETEARFDDIARFADIGDFLDQPVKTYSSGMMVRLAFAVQTAVEPEILIVDEALSVGDFFFSQKCAARMRELRQRGTTLLFVSHDMSSVRDLCEQAVYLKQGRPIFVGDCHKAIALYFREGQQGTPAAAQDTTLPPAPAAGDDAWERLRPGACWNQDAKLPPDGARARLLSVATRDEHGQATLRVQMGQELTLLVLFRVFEAGRYRVAVEIKNRYDQLVNCSSCYTCGLEPAQLAAGETGLFELKMGCALEAGQYSFHVVLSAAGEDRVNRGGEQLDATPWLGPLAIHWDYNSQRAPFLGMFGLPMRACYLNVGALR